jgi:hypothetical protein
MACTDVQTIQAGNGTKTQFSFDFPYIFKSEIHVYFWNVTTKEYDEKLTTDATYPWQITDANPTIVEFTGTAPPSPSAPTDPNEPTVDNVKIRRITKVDDIRALFNPGSAIRSEDLNKNFEQLRYAIQEANCQGIPDDVDAYLKNYYWNNFDSTVYSTETWDSDDDQVATTQAIDARIDSKIDSALTVDIIGADGINVQDDTPGSGQITVGLSDNSVDFDKIKDADQIKLADQNADYANAGSDDKVFTSLAAIRRFENYVQDTAPSGTGIGKGAVWTDIADDKTLSVWDGANWQAITSGGTFSNQPKVVYVDASSGSDANDGHRISRPKKTIKAAVEQINNDATYGDGSIVSVAPGIYAETLPIDITRNDVGIIGQSLRTCIIHPKIPAADQAGYSVDVPESQELQTMFRVNSGSYFKNLTLTGLKASGTRGGTGSLYTDSTYGLPPNQGWNFAFYPSAIIKKSPYIQNCTNFSDSQINNVNFTPHTPGEGAAGDLDSAPCGGGILVDGSVPHVNSPLRSIVCDSYTHTALDGPGIFVTNNGYAQCTSSYAFFNHAHITCINGGQANLAASTSDFGRFGLIADGKSSTAIFTSNVDGAATSGSTTFNINAPAAGTGWFGSATRPANNMLVTVNSVTYPVLSATARTDSEGGAGWTVTISRPDPTDAATNLGLNGALSDNLAVSFFLRSMIASSGHTMEYVGSGTNYTALPENGGVPIEDNQIKELNNGKVWSATTDHKGKFKLGDFFIVDQQEGSISVNDGSFQVNLNTLSVNLNGQAAVGADLDMGANEITSTTGDLKLDASGDINAQTNKITNVVNPTAAQDAATKAYVDSTVAGIDELIEDTTPQLGGNLDVNNFSITSTSNANVVLDPNGTGDIVLDANVGIGTSSPAYALDINDNVIRIAPAGETNAIVQYGRSSTASQNWHVGSTGTGLFNFWNGNEGSGNLRMSIAGDGNVGIGNSNPFNYDTTANDLVVGEAGQGDRGITIASGTSHRGTLMFADGTTGLGEYAGYLQYHHNGDFLAIATNNAEAMRIDSGGNVGIGTSSPSQKLEVNGLLQLNRQPENDSAIYFGSTTSNYVYGSDSSDLITFGTNNSEKVRIQSNGNVGIGTSSPDRLVHIQKGDAGSAVSDANTALMVENSSHSIIQMASPNTVSNRICFGDPQNANAGRLTYDHNVDTFTIHVNGSERMRITSGGTIRINQTSSDDPSGNGVVGVAIGTDYISCNGNQGNSAVFGRVGSDGSCVLFRRHTSNVGSISVNSTSTSYNENSDYRLKENVVDLDGAITRVKQLAPKRFNFIVDAETTVDGFLAHEAQAVVPESVTGTKDEVDDDGNPVYQGIDKSKLVPLLTAALQEAIAKIEMLETKVAALEAG